MTRKNNISLVNFLIVVCVAIFLGMAIVETSLSFDGNVLIRFGARSNFEIINGEYYRVFLSTIIHAGLFHLLSNMFIMKIAGDIVEMIFGKLNFFLIVFASGLIGSLLSFACSVNTISVGASGIAFGIMGSHLALFLTNRRTYKQLIGMDLIVLLALNLVIGFIDSSIDSYAHIGGLIAGFVISYLLLALSEKKSLSRVLSIIAFLVLSAAIYGYGYNNYVNSGAYAYHKTLHYLERDMPREALAELMNARQKYPDNENIEKLMNAILMGGSHE